MADARAHPALLPTDLPPTCTATPTAHSITSSRWKRGPSWIPVLDSREVVILGPPALLTRPPCPLAPGIICTTATTVRLLPAGKPSRPLRAAPDGRVRPTSLQRRDAQDA